MSLLKQFNITNELMAKYSPLDQLLPKYLSQVLKEGQVLTFDSGDQIFEKQHAIDKTYYLLKGKLKLKKGVIFSKTLKAGSSESFSPINSLVPDGVSAKASDSGHMLLLDPELLDRALGWSEAEKDKIAKAQEDKAEGGQTADEAQGFDEEHFTWITSLMEFPLFFNLPPSNMETLLEKFEKLEVSTDQVVINEGDLGDYFYLLMKGTARVIIGGDESRPIRLSRGAYFGEEALISDTARSATVIMDSEGVLARLDKESFQSLLNNPLVQHVTYAKFKEETLDNSAFEELDIRAHSEFEHIPFPKCLHIPLSDLRQQLETLDKSKVYYLTEEGGQRSEVAAHILCQNSFKAKVIRS